MFIGTNEVIQVRWPRIGDGKAVYDLVLGAKPLDVNSRYCYFLVCSHFEKTSAVAEAEDRIVGFLSAYTLPERPHVLFVWQVAVDSSHRGQGVAAAMLESILARERCANIRRIETTVTPSNRSSRNFFKKFAERHGAGCTEEPYLSEEMFGEELHEGEFLLGIEPPSGSFRCIDKGEVDANF